MLWSGENLRSRSLRSHFFVYLINSEISLFLGRKATRSPIPRTQHLSDVERNDKNASKPDARHFNHARQHMAVCSLSPYLGSSEGSKTVEQKCIFQIGTLNPHGINECFSLK